jgi:hypothetical protein
VGTVEQQKITDHELRGRIRDAAKVKNIATKVGRSRDTAKVPDTDWGQTYFDRCEITKCFPDQERQRLLALFTQNPFVTSGFTDDEKS